MESRAAWRKRIWVFAWHRRQEGQRCGTVSGQEVRGQRQIRRSLRPGKSAVDRGERHITIPVEQDDDRLDIGPGGEALPRENRRRFHGDAPCRMPGEPGQGCVRCSGLFDRRPFDLAIPPLRCASRSALTSVRGSKERATTSASIRRRLILLPGRAQAQLDGENPFPYRPATPTGQGRIDRRKASEPRRSAFSFVRLSVRYFAKDPRDVTPLRADRQGRSIRQRLTTPTAKRGRASCPTSVR